MITFLHNLTHTTSVPRNRPEKRLESGLIHPLDCGRFAMLDSPCLTQNSSCKFHWMLLARSLLCAGDAGWRRVHE